jgi:hypothetical protein
MLGMEDMELPRVRMRVKPPVVGERGGAVGSVASDDVRACSPPNVGPAVPVLAALMPPNARARGFGDVAASRRGGAGFESNRIVLGMAGVSSWAMMMRQSRG